MRLHEFSTRKSRLRHLKKVFDQIYRELAQNTRRKTGTGKRKHMPSSDPQAAYVGRSVLSARFPTFASTVRNMPQQVVAKRSRGKRTVAARSAAPVPPPRITRTASRAATPTSAISKQPPKATLAKQDDPAADATTEKAKQSRGQATRDQRNTKVAATKNQATQPPITPPYLPQRSSQTTTQPQLARTPMPRVQQAPNPNVQAWRLANQPPMPHTSQLAPNSSVPPKR
jgi:hypothetical protein